MAQDYRELVVWQKAIDLTVLIYKITESFPRNEVYGLTSQMRRAGISIASNIAEGRGRLNAREFRQFLGVARGSTCELQTQLHVAKLLGYDYDHSISEAETRSNELSKMLHAFIQKLAVVENPTPKSRNSGHPAVS
jgi:four helix bundle protein